MSYNMTNVLGILFANTHEGSVPELSAKRTMASIPFGGRFRMVDFLLSGMSNSGMSKVGIITRTNYQSLLDHIGSARPWDLSRNDGGLTLLTPYGRNNQDNSLFKGKLDALYSCIGYIRHTDCEYTVLSDCDLVINPDFTHLVDEHIASGADITAVCHTADYTEEQTREAACFKVENGRVTKVAIDRAMAGERTMDLNIYVMKTSLLISLVDDLVSLGKYSFSRDVLQEKCSELNIGVYEFGGFYRRISDLESYYEANMALLCHDNLSKLVSSDRPIYTKDRADAPAKYGFDSSVSNSLVANGCVIEGVVENSILFRGVKVAKGAVIKNSILMQDTVVGRGSSVTNIITDKNVTIGDGLTVSSSENCPLYIAKGRTL